MVKASNKRTRLAAKSPEPVVDDVLARLPSPTWLVRGSLQDNDWIVGTEDPGLKRRSEVRLCFTVPIAPGPVRLSDPSCRRDLLTAKLYVFYGLSASDGWLTASSSALLDVKNLLTLIRWRRQRGIDTMQELSGAWFDDFCRSLQAGGVEGLVRSSERMTAYLDRIRSDGLKLPSTRKARRRHLDMEAVIAALGFADARQIAPSARIALYAAARRQGLTLLPAQQQRMESEHDSEETEPLCNTRMAPLLSVWQRLYALRGRMPHDPLNFDAFVAGGTPGTLARALGAVDPGRTKSAPALQTCHLIDRALRWVLDYAPDLEVLLAACRRHYTAVSHRPECSRVSEALENALAEFQPNTLNATAPGAPWPLLPKTATNNRGRKAPEGVPLRLVYLELLPAAAAIVIAAFSARRREEIESLRAGCVVRGEDGEAWLQTWINKVRRGADLIPISEAVVQTTALLERLSAPCRERHQTPWLFVLPELLALDRKVAFAIHPKMKLFAKFVGVPPLPDGTEWNFTPHQMRRFFAMVYYHRFRFPSLTALSDFLRHHDPDVTRRYITEAAGGGFLRMSEERRVAAKDDLERQAIQERRAAFQDFEDVRLAFMRERFTDVVQGQTQMGGYGGEQLKSELEALVREAKRLVEIRSAPSDDAETTFDVLLADFVKPRRLEPNGQGHSYCKCTGDPANLAVAACLQMKRADGHDVSRANGPDHAYAADLTCSSCPHNVQFTENEAYWTQRIEADRRLAENAPSKHLKAFACQRLAAAEAHRQRCFIGVRPVVGFSSWKSR